MPESRVQNNENVNPGVKIYNLVILIVDIITLFAKWFYFTIESIVLLFVTKTEKDVKDDIVLITGAGHGMGRELALQYSRLGATIVCWDINEKMNNDTVATIKAAHGKAYGYVCDVTNREAVLELGKKVKSEVGVVTILINNAGIMPTHPVLQHTENEITKIFEINVLAHFWMFQTFLPDMVQRNRGHIVAMSSMAGVIGLENLVPYCGSKFAVRGIMEALHEETRQNAPNVKFTCIYPYMVDTGLCKNPKMRFPELMKLVNPIDAAAAIVKAQRTEELEVSIPKYMFYLNGFTRLFPTKVAIILKDFLDSGVESDLH